MAADYFRILDALDEGMKAFNAANPVTLLGPDGISYIYNNAAMDVAWENVRYEPQIGRPYQDIHLLSNETQQPGNGADGVSFDQGIYQIGLYYPRDEGAGAAIGRADLLRRFFKRSTVLTSGGVSVQVERTPSLSGPIIGPDWYKRVVSIYYFLYS